MVTAIYPGTFDPLTRGHEDLVRRAARLFGRLVVAIADSRAKQPLFEIDERVELARAALADCDNVQVQRFSGLLRDFVVAQSGNVVIRGLRAVSDFDYEFQLAGMNRHLMPEVETVFMTPSDRYQFVSATLVREIALFGGDVSAFVPPPVEAALAAKRAERAARAG